MYQILSPNDSDEGVWINQDAWMFQGEFSTAKEVTYDTHLPNQGVFLMVIEGEIEFEGNHLKRRDAVEIFDTNSFSFNSFENAEVLLIEVPMNL